VGAVEVERGDTAYARRHRPGTPGFRRLNLAMGAAGLAAFGMLYSTQPLLPQLGEDLGVDPTAASLTVSVTTGALALLVIPATALGVRVGRVRIIKAGLLAAVLLSFLAALAPSYAVLLGVRGLTGACLAGVVGVAMGHVAAEVHPGGLATAMGLYVSGNTLGGVGGRLIGSAIVDLGSWRVAVAGVAVAAALATACFWWLLPPQVGDDETAAPREPHALRELLATPAVLAVLVLPFLLMGGFVASYNYLTYRMADAPFALPPAAIGLIFLAYLAGTVTSTLAGRCADRVGRGPVLLVSIVVMGAGVALTVPDSLALVVVGLVVLTGGFFGAHSIASGWAPVLGGRHGTRASGLYVGSYYAGSSVFGALVGLAWAGGGWGATAAAVGALVVAALVAATLLVTRLVDAGTR